MVRFRYNLQNKFRTKFFFSTSQDQISLTELRRFYFGPTLAESILYGYDCLQEFFGWNGSDKKKNVEPVDSNSLQQFESIEALDENIVNPQIKTEKDLDESIGKELVVASMSNGIKHSERYFL